MGRTTKPNINTTIFAQLDREDADQFPRAIIVTQAGGVAGTIDLTPVVGVEGKYRAVFTFVALGDYSIKFIVHKDAAHTIENKRYKLGDQDIRVSDLEDNVESLLSGEFGEPIAVFD